MQDGARQLTEPFLAGTSPSPSSQSRQPTPSLPLIPKRPHDPGSGHLHLSNPSSARFSTLRASYPLKLLAPERLPSQPANMATAYTLAYGGGLVAGDVVSLDVDVDAGCGLVLLTQGSTKVFKHRPGIRPMSHRIIRDGQLGKDSCTVGHAQDKEGPAMRGQGQRLCDGQAQLITRQRMLIKLGTGSLCILMPDSVSPFRSSRYSQAQRFVLPADRSASLLVLDWVNSGRGYRGPGRTFIDGDDREVWAMNFYGSTNEVLIGDQFIMRERLVLDNDQCHGPAKANDPHGSSAPNQQPQRSENLTKVARQLAPYHVYGSLLILGPAFAPLVAYLNALIDHTSQMQIHTPPSLLWSYSSTDEQGGVLRLAAEEVEDAQRWLREVMTFAGVQHVVGEGLWPRVI